MEKLNKVKLTIEVTYSDSKGKESLDPKFSKRLKRWWRGLYDLAYNKLNDQSNKAICGEIGSAFAEELPDSSTLIDYIVQTMAIVSRADYGRPNGGKWNRSDDPDFGKMIFLLGTFCAGGVVAPDKAKVMATQFGSNSTIVKQLNYFLGPKYVNFGNLRALAQMLSKWNIKVLDSKKVEKEYDPKNLGKRTGSGSDSDSD